MGRRSLSDPLKASAARRLQAIVPAFDLAELEAQLYATDAVDLLAGLMMDVTLKPEDLPVARFRAEMALHVLDRAYGKPGEKLAVIQQPAQAEKPDGVTLEIEAVKRDVAETSEMRNWMAHPFNEWPEHLQRRFAALPAPEPTPLREISP